MRPGSRERAQREHFGSLIPWRRCRGIFRGERFRRIERRTQHDFTQAVGGAGLRGRARSARAETPCQWSSRLSGTSEAADDLVAAVKIVLAA